MLTVDVALGGRAYPVCIGADLLGEAALWQRFSGTGKCLVVTNAIVAPLYLERVLDSLPASRSRALVLPDGESSKTVATWNRVIDELIDFRAGRDATVIALGGGVVGDISGFAAASYMRGIAFVQVPTTLLAQVDASVGGKTGVNHAQGKNLIGAFHQPRAVLADTATLDTLPEREYLAGLAEVVKYGAIRDESFLAWLEDRATRVLSRDPDTVAGLIERSVRNKAAVVAEDELEAGPRALLNFGHSFGHAIETLTAYERYLHGEAVAIGMVVAARLSEARGLCAAGVAERLAGLLSTFGLPVTVLTDIDARAIIDCLSLDKKALGGKSRLVLLRAPGSAVVDALSTPGQIEAAIEACR
jgi:3-dehydroquinate synthase